MGEYRVKEIFRTIQGEGHFTGTPAVFVRFAGCNLWSGKEEDRDSWAKRTGAWCPRICDTDFRGGDKITRWEVADRVRKAQGTEDPRLIVFTGGEPLLQLDLELVEELSHRWPDVTLSVETNGTIPFGETKEGRRLRRRLWVTISPKVPQGELSLTEADELKLLWPSYRPARYSALAGNCSALYIQPEADGDRLNVKTMTEAAEFVMKNPRWNLSIQTHKVIGVR